ncbi:hypothetical protein KL935_002975 [Ogataea polymorpha]|uniref:uncharacterized protein n=1 Tax=Ogataea polymorpha TaxID=460523 RepID=UPI0007F4E56F|nr:uncharacterized protein OGAPODRAFT_15878 [Ogataea polymorpha]KAG7888438.1 hypothetical protein KL936_003650 [Ogataea polymorpha]KAG7892385.1 hypothetical protein KL908_003337 [Ogataea polymorpha]KAG7900232.1 hypothetical protein KL935_002975 [Ogataea polymorpha]KAG7935668.1 hypothetical protein KL934_002227 [Ogataea polymorpha]OBA17745.1 hypothetical protein OGAPODRAFT_15878 [Ogataea polymorpha]
MPLENYTLTILGCGTMGTAVLAAMLQTKFEPYPAKIICCTNSEKSALKLKETYGDKIEVSFGAANNAKAVGEAEVLMLGCKPFLCEQVYDQVKSHLPGDQLVISLLAGWSIDQLRIWSPKAGKIARVMTNTPAKFGCGVAVVSFSDECLPHEDFVLKIVGGVGTAIKLPERNQDAATALVGSGVAFSLLFMEALTEGGIRMGIPAAIAQECAAKVMEGTAKMVKETGQHPGALKLAACTPGGCTIGGLLVMEDKGVRSGVSRAVEEATNIASQLGKK